MSRFGRTRWRLEAALAGGFALLAASASQAGTMGVPTNLNADGTTSGTTANPAGWMLLQGTNSPPADGDVTFQFRIFIEVPSTTLDIRVFDPGTSGARDLTGDGALSTTFELRNPCAPIPTCVGAIRQSLTINNDTATTDNRLSRFSSTAAWTAATAGTPFTGLTAGLYELRVFATGASDEVNAFGVDIRDQAGNSLEAFVIARTAAADSALTMGTLNSGGAPFANIVQPMLFHPFVDRGCAIETSNFDMDSTSGQGAGGNGNITDVFGTVTALTMSQDGDASPAPAHSENAITVEPATGVNQDSTNYGIYSLTNHTGSQQNVIDWRVADYQTWSDVDPGPATSVRNPISPIRLYLPNRSTYMIGGTVTLPSEPVLRTSLQYVSGPNAPTTGSVTRMRIYGHLDNMIATGVPATSLTTAAITINVPAPATVDTGVGVSAFIEGVATTCSATTVTANRVSCTFANPIPANQTATIRFEVTLNPPAAGTYSVTATPAAAPNGVFATFLSGYNTNTTAGPLCDMRVNTTNALTRAALRGLRVDPSGEVEFATSGQRNTAAFNVYGTNDRSGRDRVLLTTAPIAASVPNSVLPLLYRARTLPVTTRYVLIEEIELGGQRNLMGPFAVGDARLRTVLERVERRLADGGLGGNAHEQSRQRGERHRARVRGGRWGRGSSRASFSEGVKIEVEEAGRVRVSWDDLQAQGLPAHVRRDHLELAAQGVSVPFTVEAGADGRPEALVFEAEALSTAYTSRNVYVLTWRGGAAPSVGLTRWADAPQPGFRRVERDSFFVPSAPQGGDPWLWDLLIGDGSVWPYPDWDPVAGEFDLAGLPDGLSGMVPVRIRVSGYSAHEHTVEAWVNGASIGRVRFLGTDRGLLVGEVPAESLRASGNQLQLQYTANSASPDDYGYAYLDYLELGVPQPTAEVTPVRVSPYDPGFDGLQRGTDYLIVAHSDFIDQAQRLASVKSAAGLQAVVVDLERAYDRFSGGVVEAGAVRELIRHAARVSRVRYVLLLGDDSFDHSDRLGLDVASYVPSLHAWDGQFGRVPSENLYADVDGDGAPDVAIGRLPAQSADEAEAMVAKVARQGDVLRRVAGRHLMAVDNPSGSVVFKASAQRVAAGLPAGARVTWADVGEGADAAHAALMEGLRQGSQVTHYFGHGGPEVWADEALLGADDVAELAGSTGESVVLTWACEAQWFQYPLGDTVGEALLRLPQGGALASFGPAGITDVEDQSLLYSEVYAKLFRPGITLGETIRQAKVAASRNPRSRSVVDGWNLLGDPALRLDGGR
jgi:hypothetical protein